MAKYTVNFSCGHIEVKQLFGKTSDRDNTISYWEQSGTCTECWKKEQEAKRVAELNDVNAANLPTLTGSEKQITWAEKIRAGAYTSYKNNGFTTISNETLASWWIENRNDIVEQIYSHQLAAKKDKLNQLKSMSKSDMFKRAHVLAKRMTVQYPDTDYRTNFALALKELYAALKALKAA